jgi:hypothetical protein
MVARPQDKHTTEGAQVWRLGDAILGVYNRDARRLTLQVGSGYQMPNQRQVTSSR